MEAEKQIVEKKSLRRRQEELRHKGRSSWYRDSGIGLGRSGRSIVVWTNESRNWRNAGKHQHQFQWDFIGIVFSYGISGVGKGV